MAEIDVVKKGSRAWIWIMMIAVLALIAWFVMGANRSHTVGQLEIGAQPQIAAVAGASVTPSARAL